MTTTDQIPLPPTPDQLAQQARRLLDGGDPDGALDAAERALAVDPGQAEARRVAAEVLCGRAMAAYNAEDYQAALGWAEQARAMNPESRHAQAMYGLAWFRAAPPFTKDGAGRSLLNYLEMDIAYACNLHCAYCTHYSNYTVKGVVEYERGRQWIEAWGRRVNPKHFRILGGEPTLNPGLSDYIRLAARVWPASARTVVTNGFFVDRHPDLFAALAETGTQLQLSLHGTSPEYLEKARLAQLEEASRRHGFFFYTLDQTEETFYRLYQGTGPAMRPFQHGAPEASWRACGNAGCNTIHQGRLWKCPPIAFLGNAEAKFDLAQLPEWQPYLQHKGLGLDASDAELEEYLTRPSYFCAMCPAERVPAVP